MVMESREQHKKKQKAEADARAARLANLFDSDDEEPESKQFDRDQAFEGVGSLFDRVNVHLQVEKKLLDSWFDNDMIRDEQERKKRQEEMAA